MNCLIALAFAAGAAPQVPGTPGAPVAAGSLDGNWTVVYAENLGRPVRMAPTLAVQNGAVTINLGQPVTYRLDLGPGHAIQAIPASATSLGTTPAVPPSAGAGPKPANAPGAGGVGSGEITSPGVGPRETPVQSPPARTAPEPGTLQGVFILSHEYLCISMSPVGTQALGASPGSVIGTDVGPGASPVGRNIPAPPLPQPGPNAAGGGIRQDAFVLILRRAAPAARAR